MTSDRLYETETMAELCARQGRLGEAIAIYRRLLDDKIDDATRSRARARLRTLEASWQPVREMEAPPADIPLPPSPGVVIQTEDGLTILIWI